MTMVSKNTGGRPRLKPAPDFDQAVGQRIKLKRELSKMSPQKLADRTGFSPFQVGRFESGDTPVKPEALARIADALGCKASDFLDGIKVKK
jgi:transcriptional regulator with XRE-family HTH domain